MHEARGDPNCEQILSMPAAAPPAISRADSCSGPDRVEGTSSDTLSGADCKAFDEDEKSSDESDGFEDDFEQDKVAAAAVTDKDVEGRKNDDAFDEDEKSSDDFGKGGARIYMIFFSKASLQC